MSNILTIGIPTYNRKEAASSCLENLKNNFPSKEINVLLIDNCSEDGSFEFLKNRYQDTPFEIIKNRKNLGFSGNTIQLIKECKTDYLLWNPDEDKIIKENVTELIDFLNMNKPKLVCPQYYLEKELYRGKTSIGEIYPKDIWHAAPHLPGIIFHVPSCMSFINEFDKIEKNYPNAYNYYPQIFLLSKLILKGKCFYWDKPINEQDIFIDDTHSLDESGVGYFGLSMRWRIHKEFVYFFEELLNVEKNNLAVKDMLSVQKNRLFQVIRQSIENESPDLLIDFDRGVVKRLFSLFSFLIKDLFMHPISLLKKIVKLFGIKK
tara:strand:+ start:90 stop:1049 length:960 start_codon:yes stop_codon:yes gene_type:complete